MFSLFPFSLDGPRFLVFYALFALVVLWGYQRLRRAGAAAQHDGGVMLDALTAEPYRIACLRGGPDEAVRVAVVNLIDRGLLVEAKGRGWRASLQGDPAVQRRSLDAVILGQCKAAPMSAEDIVADRTVRKAAAALETDLQGQGLLQAAGAHAAQKQLRRLVLLLLAGVALARIAQALVAGRSNIGVLAVMAVIACIVALALPPARLTMRGQRALQSLQALFGRLKDRAGRLVPGGATNEAVLFAAVFGIHALPGEAFAFVEQAYPKPKPSDSGSSSGDGGGSSDSGGSSCGGGGGCGGCGGGGGD